MTLDLDELERLEREATPGPWDVPRFGPDIVVRGPIRCAHPALLRGERYRLGGGAPSEDGVQPDPSVHAREGDVKVCPEGKVPPQREVGRLGGDGESNGASHGTPLVIPGRPAGLTKLGKR